MSLRWRLTLFYTALIVVIGFIIGTAVFWTTRAGLYQVLDKWLWQAAQDFARPYKAGRKAEFSPRNKGLDKSADEAFFTVFTDATLESQQLDTSPVQPLFYDGIRSGSGYRIAMLQADNGYWVQAARLETDTQNTLESVQRLLLWGIPILTLIGLATGSILVGRAFRPIGLVSALAQQIALSGDAKARVPVPHGQDELVRLTSTVNAMLERLESSFETQRRFTADASHELRTPVTAIAGHASYLMRRTNPTEAQKESLEAITNLSVRLGRLIGDLLDLARADAGFGVERVSTNLMSLAEDVHLEVVAIAGNTEIELLGDSSLKAQIDPNRVRQVIRNLVQNALKAGSSKITVEISKEETTARVTVQDNGSGIASEHLSKLFDRFYRVDTSRDRAAGGSGLGLSIVKWIVEAHQGSIDVSSELGVGTRIEVRFPIGDVGLPSILKSPTPQG